MGLFGKKTNDYEEASKNLNEDNQSKTAAERIIMEQLVNDDQRALDLVLELKKGNPLIINFEKLDNMGANKMLAFLTGACCALDGNTVKINEHTFLFARKVDFLDGSLKEFMEEL